MLAREPRVSRRPTLSGWKPSTSFAGSIVCIVQAQVNSWLDAAALAMNVAAGHCGMDSAPTALRPEDQQLESTLLELVMTCRVHRSEQWRTQTVGLLVCKACKMAALVAEPGDRATHNQTVEMVPAHVIESRLLCNCCCAHHKPQGGRALTSMMASSSMCGGSGSCTSSPSMASSAHRSRTMVSSSCLRHARLAAPAAPTGCPPGPGSAY